MLIAQSKARDFLLLGLSRGNVALLTQGKPIKLTRQTHGDAIPAGLTVALVFGETEQDIAQMLAEHDALEPDVQVRPLPAEQPGGFEETLRAQGLDRDDAASLTALREAELARQAGVGGGPSPRTFQAELGIDEKGRVVLKFGKKVSWVALTKEQALTLANALGELATEQKEGEPHA